MPKKCNNCQEQYDVVEANFYRKKGTADGFDHRCIACHKKASRKSYEKNKDKVLENSVARAKRNPELARQYAKATYDKRRASGEQQKYARKKNLAKYRMTEDDYLRMVESQNGLCAICNGVPLSRWGKLYVDHDHDTGEVRGLLCSNCNVALGLLKHDLELLAAAAVYLKKAHCVLNKGEVQ